MMKLCSNCSEHKEIEMFARDSSKRDGHRAMCKKCWNVKKIVHNKAYKEKYKKKNGGRIEQVARAERLGVSVEVLIVGKAMANVLIEEQRRQRLVKHRNMSMLRQISFENSCMVKEKQCFMCSETKSITEFHKRSKNRDGHEGRCKACEKGKSSIYQKSEKYKQYRMSEEYKKKEREQSKKYNSDPKNKDTIRLNSRVQNYKRRERIKQDGGHITAKELRDLKSMSSGRCYWCDKKIKKDDLHYDHYTPLSKGGRNIIDNIVIACSYCNLSKKNKMPEEFAFSHGRLL